MNVTATILVQLLLWIWFLGCTITWRFGKRILVEGMGFRSAEFVMLCLYSIGLISYYFFQPTGKWILFAILVLWFVIQFFCHWYYTIFGASKQKLKGYNECFRGTLRLIPVSEKAPNPGFLSYCASFIDSGKRDTLFAIPYAGIEALQSEGLLSRIKEAKCGESDNEHIGKAERFSVSDSRAESIKK